MRVFGANSLKMIYSRLLDSIWKDFLIGRGVELIKLKVEVFQS